MRTYKVSFRSAARNDLLALYRYIAREAGRRGAKAYIKRIESVCQALQTFPERGSARDDIRPPMRTIGFEGRVTIIFRIDGERVRIYRILYGGQDIERALRGVAND